MQVHTKAFILIGIIAIGFMYLINKAMNQQYSNSEAITIYKEQECLK